MCNGGSWKGCGSFLVCMRLAGQWMAMAPSLGFCAHPHPTPAAGFVQSALLLHLLWPSSGKGDRQADGQRMTDRQADRQRDRQTREQTHEQAGVWRLSSCVHHPITRLRLITSPPCGAAPSLPTHTPGAASTTQPYTLTTKPTCTLGAVQSPV